MQLGDARPLFNTMTRSQTAASSSASDEHITTATPSAACLGQEAIDGALGPDVDTLGRFVEHEHDG